MLDINASAEGVFVFIANPQCFFIDSPQAPCSRAHNAHHFGRGKAADPGLLLKLAST